MVVTAMSSRTGDEPRPPGLGLFVTEPLRGALTLATLPAAAPFLSRAPRGDGHGVLVLPGLLASDTSTGVLRRFLERTGYVVRGWGLGRNVGPTREILTGMHVALRSLAADTDGPVSLVGWSLGGIFARELARDNAEIVRQVITLGSPFALTDPRQSRANDAYRRTSRRHDPNARVLSYENLMRPVPVPSTAVYTRGDGIVHWLSCVGEDGAQSENVRVRCGHLGLGVDPATLWVVADRLAQPAGRWRPFRAPAALRGLFPAG